MRHIRFGRTHKDSETQYVLKIRVGATTLKLTRSNATDIMHALINDAACEGIDLRETQWRAQRDTIETYRELYEKDVPYDNYMGEESQCLDLTDDWGDNSWQRIVIMCKSFVG